MPRGGRRIGSGAKKGNKHSSLRKEILELISDKDMKDAFEVCRTVLTGDDLKLALQAATYLIDQRFGRPKQRTELTGEDGGKVSLEIIYIKN